MMEQIHIFGDIPSINATKEYYPPIYTVNSGMPGINDYQAYLDNAIQYNHNSVSVSNYTSDTNLKIMVENIHRAGKGVHVSYIFGNYETELQRFIKAGVDYVLGNNPKIMQDYVKSLNVPSPQPASQGKFKTSPMINKTIGRFKPVFYVKKDFGFVKASDDKYIAK